MLGRFASGQQTAGHPLPPKLLAVLTAIDLEYRWRRVRAEAKVWLLEDYLACYPELNGPEEFFCQLIGAEYRVRQRWGDRPTHTDYAARFPRQAAQLQLVLAQVDAELKAELQPGQPLPELPTPRPPAGPSGEGAVRMYPTIASVIDRLRGLNLLSQNQLSQVLGAVQSGAYSDARSLVRDLLDRNWLTAFQANQLMHGRDTEQVIGPYLLLERLGEGGAGQVFKARHQKMNRIVALKLIRKELLTDAEVLGRFYREIQVVSQLDHPNVVHAYDAGPAVSTHFLAMEYVEGTDLGKMVKNTGPLPVEQACAYIRQAALGLQHAHEKGLVHRDIKPHNLILSLKEALIKVTDLGLARLVRPANEEATAMLTDAVKSSGTLTPHNAVLIGTADYMAPEQALDFHAADIRSDIYSLGCTFYYLLTGQPPFAGGTLAQKLLKHQQAEPPGMEQFRQDVPAEVLAVLRRMLAKRPGDRYQTPAQVVDQLAATLAPNAVGPRRPRSRGRKIPLGVAGAVLLLPIVLALFLFHWRQGTDPPTRQGSISPSANPAKRSSPFDELDPGMVSKALRSECPELVAVFGKPSKPVPHWPPIAISPDGTLIAIGLGNVVEVWEVPSGKLRQRLEHRTPETISKLLFSPDSQTLAATHTWNLALWDVRTGKMMQSFGNHHRGNIQCLAFSPDGTLASGGDDKQIKFLKLGTGKALEPISLAVKSLAFSPDGTLAMGIQAKRPRFVNLAANHSPQDLPTKDRPNDHSLHPVAFSPDGKTFVWGGSNLVEFWNLGGAQYELDRYVPLKPNILVQCLAFSADGRRLACWGPSAGRMDLLLLDVASRTLLRRWPLPGIRRLAFAPDGRHVACLHEQNQIWIMRLQPTP